MVGMIVGVLVTGGTGLLIAWLGWLVWKKEKITLLHDYHTDKVSTENMPAFCKLSGIGLIVIGTGGLTSAVLLALTGSAYSFVCFAVCYAAGLALLTKADRKYNR